MVSCTREIKKDRSRFEPIVLSSDDSESLKLFQKTRGKNPFQIFILISDFDILLHLKVIRSRIVRRSENFPIRFC